jgi:hypothetical protein
MTLGITTLGVMTLSVTKLRIKRPVAIMMYSITTLQNV